VQRNAIELETVDAEQLLRFNIMKEKGHSLGTKRIGIMASFMFVINQIFGPGALAIPIVYQQAGVIPTIAIMTVFMCVSSFASTMLVDAMARVPGNHAFDERMEFSPLVKHYFGRVAHFLFQILLYFTLQSLTVTSINVCAESMDSLFVFVIGKSAAFEFYPDFGFHLIEDAGAMYDGGGFYLSVGFCLILVLSLPMGFFNLDDNIWVQWVSFFGLITFMSEFMFDYVFVERMMPEKTPLLGSNFAQLSSVFITAWGYPMLIPSWANEMHPTVYPHVNMAIWGSAAVTESGYIAFSLLASWAYPYIKSDDFLDEVNSRHPIVVTQLCVYLFALFIIMPGIPVNCITARYNLYVGGLLGKRLSYAVGVVFPWLVAPIFAQGPLFSAFLNWSALIFVGFVNFIVPFMLFFAARLSERRMHAGLLTSKHSLPYNRMSAIPRILDPFAEIIAVFLMLVTTTLIISGVILNIISLAS
jgi:amino acid permease